MADNNKCIRLIFIIALRFVLTYSFENLTCPKKINVSLDILDVHIFSCRMFQKLIKRMYSFLRHKKFDMLLNTLIIKKIIYTRGSSCVYCPTKYHHLFNYIFFKILVWHGNSIMRKMANISCNSLFLLSSTT